MLVFKGAVPDASQVIGALGGSEGKMRMPLFGGKSQRVLTINGHPQPEPEGPGTAQRRYRLFAESMHRLTADPLANNRALGQPLGRGSGLEGLVAKIAPLFDSEQSLIRWVAFRGAFSALYIHIFDQSSAVASTADLQKAMGLEWATDHSGQRSLEVAEPGRSRLSDGQRASVLTAALQVLVAVGDYPRLQALGASEVNSDARYARFGDPVALDCIAFL
jgi:hypothetical protein